MINSKNSAKGAHMPRAVVRIVAAAEADIDLAGENPTAMLGSSLSI
jgi:hypothetical protein